MTDHCKTGPVVHFIHGAETQDRSIMHNAKTARKRVSALQDEGKEVKYEYPWRFFTGSEYEMPVEQTLDELVAAAKSATVRAISVRKAHARKSKRGTPQRDTDIKIALEGLREAMKPIRRRLARLAYRSDGTDTQRLREASQGIQRERRKLWKMKQRREDYR